MTAGYKCCKCEKYSTSPGVILGEDRVVCTACCASKEASKPPAPDELPNNHRIPIPKVKKGIDLIAGRKYPIILCECGNQDQRKFTLYFTTELIEKAGRPWQKQAVERKYVRCTDCGVTIPKIEFDMKAAKLVEESRKKGVVAKKETTRKSSISNNNKP